MPNVFGRGEKIILNGSYSNLKTSDLTFKMSKPLIHTKFGFINPVLSCGVHKHSSFYDWSKFKTEKAGVTMESSFIYPETIQHNLGLSFFFANNIALNKETPFFVREFCGPKQCSSINYSVCFDSRNSKVFATNGIYAKSNHEVINNSFRNLGYLKSDLHLEYNHLFLKDLSIQICGRIGNILELENNQKADISDLFFFGGPQNLRGFSTAGANGQKCGVCLGAKCYWLSSFHIWTTLPFSRYFGNFRNISRMQLFYNVGKAGGFTFSNIRSAIGAGLAFKIGEKARLEFNYCIPLRFQNSDVRKKFQFGIGYDFS